MNRRHALKAVLLTPLAFALSLAGCGKETPKETAAVETPAVAAPVVGNIGPAEKPR